MANAMHRGTKTDAALARRHRWLGLALAGVVGLMIGLSFAAVPLYRMFCEVTGYGGTTQRASSAPAEVLDREITVAFDANVSSALDWDFVPEQPEIRLRIGENKLAFYRIVNRSDKTLTGTATFNVTPEIAGAYFNKLECFCFQEQTLGPGQSAELPVSFFIDPAIVQDRDAKRIDRITLSYTFFKTAKTAAAKSQSAP
jgi:cytochrome c oxidase assembly protein subunit 11